MQGFIKDYRKELQSDIWLMPPLYHRVWQYLKYQVNHESSEIPMKDGSKFRIEKGQHLTSVRAIAKGVGWYENMVFKEPNPKTITVILDWLVQNGMIEISRGKGNRQYTLITLLNWEKYQSKDDDGNSKVTRNGEGRKHETDINKNNKNDLKNDKKDKTYSRKRVYDENSIHYRLANLLYQKILENNPEHKKPNLQKWADDVRLMMERDNRTEEQIAYLIDWVQKDDFWKTVILSTSKLREKFDQLVMTIKSQREKVVPINQNKQRIPRAFQSLQDWAEGDS